MGQFLYPITQLMQLGYIGRQDIYTGCFMKPHTKEYHHWLSSILLEQSSQVHWQRRDMYEMNNTYKIFVATSKSYAWVHA
jgi:hypothetical protein